MSVGALSDAASAVVSLARGILAAARERVSGLLAQLASAVRSRIDAALGALRAGLARVAGAITDAVRSARDAVTRLGAGLAAAAGSIWAAAGRGLALLWQGLQAVARTVVDAARAVVQQVGSALATVRQLLAIIGDPIYDFVADAVADPDGKIVAPIVARATPAAEEVPGQARQEVAEHEAAGASAAPATAQRTIQRDPDPQAPPAEGFWAGVWRHLGLAGQQFMAQWPVMLAKVVLGLLLVVPMLVEELPQLWAEVKGVFAAGAGAGERLDHVLGIARRVVNVVAGLVASVGIWALIIAWCGGPVAEGAVLAGYLTLSAGVIAADLAVSAAQMTKAAVSANQSDVTPENREHYLSMFVSSAIGAAVTIVMVALGAACALLAKGIRALRASATEAGAIGSGAKPLPERLGAIGEPTEVRSGNPALDPRPFEYPYSNPPNMATVPPGAPLDLRGLNPRLRYLWVVDGDGNFRFAPEGQNTADFMKPLPPDEAFRIKHGDLVPGPEGMTRGPARAGGELMSFPGPDGAPSGRWQLNNDSSYTFARVDANGNSLPWAPAESLDAVRAHLVAGGTDPAALVTSDVLAGRRAPQPVGGGQ